MPDCAKGDCHVPDFSRFALFSDPVKIVQHIPIVTHIHLVIYFWIRSSLIPTSTQIPQALLPRVAQFNKCSQVRRYRGEPLTSNDDNNCDNDINDNDCDSDDNNDNCDNDNYDKVWFLTRALDGLLLYNGGKPSGGGDFISLNLVSVINNIIISTDGVL